MPQMAPISWLTLFLLFHQSFLIFNTINYFSFLPPSPLSQKKSINQTPLNWKW
uniref:ATP synthase complex subunit 8 n=1 Tax=Soliperla sp. ZTC-2018 TaxID=2267274 RepID=A0A344KZ51_9NEOP|nr:ATP synthase F0 subunit 8 [Soliperla sp. ZTC-2018]AXB38833.1 ATP synthase F0 subunit 8 [Soliperla sp. ZTC-2018]